MSKNKIDNLFKSLENKFDTENPDLGHQERFFQKLKTQDSSLNKKKKNLWKPFIGIAASVTLIITLFIVSLQQNESRDLASVSPKMEETQNFFTSAINEELNKLKEEASPIAQNLINDALKQIKILENDYTKLKVDLTNSGDDNRVIYAMISNFQNRIGILKNTLNQIEIVKQLKNSSHDTSTTI